jgi:molecular chaperone GrpE
MEPTQEQSGVTTGAEPSDIERLKEELRQQHEMHLRTLADFDNYRRRVEREQTSADRRGKREVLLSLLEVLDSFDRAFRQMRNEPSSVSEGLQAIHRKLLNLIEAQGVTPFPSLNETFHPELHEAIGSVQSDKHEPGTVIDEVQRGYRWGDELLRPARVRVAQ